MAQVIKQRDWTEAELEAQGFDQYERKKELIMARRLPASEAPKRIITSSGDRLVAYAGDMICFVPGGRPSTSLDDYDHWPVDPDIFKRTYQAWDEWDWQPSESEKRLMELGCKPYYKVADVWAKKLDTAAYIQSLEHEKPELVKAGRYVVIGAEGEPYSMDNGTFLRRYFRRSRTHIAALWQRLLRLFEATDR